MKLNESHLERRRFLGGMICGGAAALGAGAAVPLAAYVGNLKQEPPPDFLVLGPEEYALPDSGYRIVMYGRIPALIFKVPGDDELRVFVAVCTHFDCTVTYLNSEEKIFCACHEGYYNLDGNVLAGPPPRPLRKFYTKMQDGKLVLALEQENLEKALDNA